MNGDAVAALTTALASAMIWRWFVEPPARLGPRVRPYTAQGRSTPGVPLGGDDRPSPDMLVLRLLEPMTHGIRTRIHQAVRRAGNAELVALLKKSGHWPGIADTDRVAAYRIQQLRQLGLWSVGGTVGALSMPLTTGRTLAMIVLGVVVGATRSRGRLQAAVDDRRARMRIEIYTVNQLLAMRIRSGAGVIQAVSQVVERGRGEVVGELAEALRAHRAGARAGEAFARVAAATPEPYCARTYSLLALAEERGVDLADGLLALAEDVREARREAIKRNATRRRAAMLIPTIAILAPVMLLFVGAPLPRIVLGWR